MIHGYKMITILTITFYRTPKTIQKLNKNITDGLIGLSDLNRSFVHSSISSRQPRMKLSDENYGSVDSIHVRRTDKLRREAQYHAVDEYMAHAEDHFAKRQLAGRAPRRVYVASDNSLVSSALEIK